MSPKVASKVKLGLVIGAALAAASCGPLISFGEDGPPADTYTLRYEGAVPMGSPTGPIVYVDSPQMSDGLDGHGIAVRLESDQRTSLAGAGWSTHLSDLVRDYVTLSLSASSDANMVSEGGLDIKAGCRLGTKVWAMEFVPGVLPSDDKVELSIQFSLVRLSDSRLISHPTFTETETVEAASGAGVVSAFRRAMSAAAKDYGRWFDAQSKACAS